MGLQRGCRVFRGEHEIDLETGGTIGVLDMGATS